MIENIRLSFQGIWAHKMRSFLTMLGIIIGIAAIIAIVSTIKGTSEQIKENLVGTGTNVVKVELYQGDWNYTSGDSQGGNKLPVFNDSLKDEILDLDEVTAVASYRMGSLYNGIMYGDNLVNNTTFVGVDEDYFSVMGYSVKKGRLFTEHDRKNFNKFVILDTVAADVLFAGEKDYIGKTVVIKNDAYVVIGVVEQQDSFSPKVENLNDWYTYYYNDASGKYFVTDDIWPMLFGFDEPYNVVVKPRSTEDMTKAGRKTADILNDYIGANDKTGGDMSEEESMGASLKYRSEDLLEKAKALQEVSASTSKQLIWIASISLIVGGIGVMNIMLVSVTERTREIGLKKALGARKGVILAQFLTEAAVLTSLGGMIGVGAGIGLAYIISDVAKTPVAISGAAIVVSVVFSMVIGIVFGFIPSVKAANLNPIDALRYE
ncbi:MAG: ABC transporter permease [Lachnospiraceae bacterium]|nr:ABC transporter permease [Lachnospiraceae bacterium]